MSESGGRAVSLLPTEIRTGRLRLVPRTAEHVDPVEFYAACSGEAMDEVTEYMPWEPHETPKESVDALERTRERFDAGEAAEYVVHVREDDAIAGGATFDLEWERRRAGLGFWLRKRYWGRGYSAERAFALAELAFERLNLDALSVGHVVPNENSEAAVSRYVERMGGRHEGVVRNAVPFPDGEVLDEVRYSVRQTEWAGSDAPRTASFAWSG